MCQFFWRCILIFVLSSIRHVYCEEDDRQNEKVSAGSALKAMGVSALILFLSMEIFEFLRKSTFFGAIYRPAMAREATQNGKILWPLWRSQHGWIKLPHRLGIGATTLKEDIRTVGLDALILNRYVHFGVNITRMGTGFALFLCPLYAFLGGGKEKSWVMKASTRNIEMSGVDEQDYAFAGIALISAMISTYTLYTIIQEYNWFIHAWRTALELREVNEENIVEEGAQLMYGRALLLEDIPSRLGPSVRNGQLLLPFFQRLFPAVNGFPRVISAGSYSREKYDWTRIYRRFMAFTERRQECLSEAPFIVRVCGHGMNYLFCGRCCDCLSEVRVQRLANLLEERTKFVEEGFGHVETFMVVNNEPRRNGEKSKNLSVNIECPSSADSRDFSDIDFHDQEIAGPLSVATSSRFIFVDGIHSLEKPSLGDPSWVWRAPVGDMNLSQDAETQLNDVIEHMNAQQQERSDPIGFILCRCRQIQRVFVAIKFLVRYINYLLCCSDVPRKTSTGFVVFDSWVAKVVCNEVLVTESDDVNEKIAEPAMKTFPMPNRNDIIWGNITRSPEQVHVRHWFISIISIVPVVLWYAIVTISSAVSIDVLLTTVDDDEATEVDTLSGWRAFAAEYLPLFAIIIILNVIPSLFHQIALRYIGFKTKTAVHAFVASNYSSFQFANVYISIVATSIYGVVQDILEDPYSAHKQLGDQLPLASEYLLGYIILRIGLMANYLLQPGQIFRRIFCWQSNRDSGAQKDVDAISLKGHKGFIPSRQPLEGKRKRMPNGTTRFISVHANEVEPPKMPPPLPPSDLPQDEEVQILAEGRNEGKMVEATDGSLNQCDAQLPEMSDKDSSDIVKITNERMDSVIDAKINTASSSYCSCISWKVSKICCNIFSACVRVFHRCNLTVAGIMDYFYFTAKTCVKTVCCSTKDRMCCFAKTAFDLVTGTNVQQIDRDSSVDNHKSPPPIFAKLAVKYHLIFPEVQVILVVYFLLWVICPVVSIFAYIYFVIAREIFGFMTRYWRSDNGWSEGAKVLVCIDNLEPNMPCLDASRVRPAEITRIVFDGTFDVVYEGDDDEEEFGVSIQRIMAKNKCFAGIASGNVWFFSVYSRTTACLLVSQGLGALYFGFKEARIAAAIQVCTFFITFLVRRSLYFGYEQRQSALTLVQAASLDHDMRKKREDIRTYDEQKAKTALSVPREDIECEFSQPGFKMFEHIVQDIKKSKSQQQDEEKKQKAVVPSKLGVETAMGDSYSIEGDKRSDKNGIGIEEKKICHGDVVSKLAPSPGVSKEEAEDESDL